tara:strand:- start:22957 stop:23283 length:327 start_codon:yes stop_codon:yes gene_type:complete
LGEALKAIDGDHVQRAMLLMSCQRPPRHRIYNLTYAIDYADDNKLQACILVENRKYNEYTIRGLYKLGTETMLTIEKNDNKSKKREVIYEKKNVPPPMIFKVFQDACK